MLVLGVVNAGPALALTGDVHMADPSVIVDGSCWYGYSTGFEGGPGNGAITIRKSCSTDHANGWTYVGTVWNSVPAWITTALGSTPPNIWAPDISQEGSTYYLYYGASIWGQNTKAVMGLMTATNPAGPWTDQGQVTNVDYPIDPNQAWGPNNTQYISWGSFNGVYMHVLNSSGKLSTTNNNLWKLATGIEASTIILNGGYYYLFGSKGTCCQGVNSTYYTVVGRSTSITGPYLDKNGTDMVNGGGTTVLTGVSPQVAAGGGDAFDNGTTKEFAYHYYDANNSGSETLNIRPVTFSNGWPVMGAPLS
jgi:arabinan endo-1,5-alpha-L-arabinosidase